MIVSFPAEKEYFSIGEVSRITSVKPYILRYWESRFGLLRPNRRESGQRKFTRRDVETVCRIRELLYERRFTIEGAKKHLRREEKKAPVQIPFELAESSAAAEALKEVRKELSDILQAIRNGHYSAGH